jgi:hypothetical protein
MLFFARIVVSVLAYFVANQLGFWSLSLLTSGSGQAFVASAIAIPIGLAGAVAAWKLPVWSGRATLQPSTIASVSQGALIVGAIGFCGGFFGPIIFAPEANQGPLLGIFITGPLGALLGAIGGFVYDRTRRSPSVR